MTLTLPGLRLVHEGQMEGWQLKLPVQLGRRHDEPTQSGLPELYRTLLRALGERVFHDGSWRPLDAREAWPGNVSHLGFILQQWALAAEHRVVAVNFAPGPAQCFVPLALPDLGARRWRLRDLLGPAEYVRDGADLAARGLYLDMPAYASHVFVVEPA